MTEGSELHLLILSGPTREHLDPVRYLSNASSGRLGVALTREALRRGHRVDLVEGPVDTGLEHPRSEALRIHPVVSALDMLERAEALHPEADVVIGAAAVSDYRPRERSVAKHKRAGGEWTLELVENPDILQRLGERKAGRLHLGFALESEDLLENARRKLEKKHLDWIVGNSPAAIAAEGSHFQLIGPDAVEDLGTISKVELARRLLDLLETHRRS